MRFLIKAIIALLSCAFITSAIGQPAQHHQLRFYHGHLAFSDDISNADFSAGLTLEGWFKVDENTVIDTLLAFGEINSGLGQLYNSSHSLGSQDGVHLRSKVIIEIADGTRETVTDASDIPIPIGVWTHLALSYNNQLNRVYIDGQLVGESQAMGNLAELNGRFQIGHVYNQGFRGFAREIRIWNKGLSQVEIQQVSQSQVIASSANLVANWPLNKGFGQVEADQVAGAQLFLGESEQREVPGVEPSWALTNPYYLVNDTAVDDVEPLNQTEGKLGIVAAWGVGDFNQDGFQDFIYGGPESYTEINEVPYRIFLNDGTGVFNESTSEVIDGPIPHVQHAYSKFVVEDLNGDGLVDVFGAGHGLDDSYEGVGEPNVLLLSSATSGKLTWVTGNILGPPCVNTTPAYEGQTPCGEEDFGDPKIILYPDVSAIPVIPPIGWTHSLSHADIDNDGDIDIYVGNVAGALVQTSAYFLINDGEGRFTVDWQKAPERALNLSTASRSKLQSLLEDLDGDGFVDLTLTSGALKTNTDQGVDFGLSYIFWGDGTGVYDTTEYLEIATIAGFAKAPTPPLALDIDNDGDLDLVLGRTGPNYSGRYLQIFRNEGNRNFLEVTSLALPAQDTTGAPAISTHRLDFDSNGCDDILLSTEAYGFQSELVWISDCAGGFRALPNAVFGKLGFLIPIDAHGDGDLDFIVAQRKPAKNFGDNPFINILAFALLEKLRPLDMGNIFSKSEPLTGPATYSDPVLTIPVVAVESTYYRVGLTLYNLETLEFQVTTADLLIDPELDGQTVFDGSKLIIPEVVLGTSRYKVELTLSDIDTLMFVVSLAEEL